MDLTPELIAAAYAVSSNRTSYDEGNAEHQMLIDHCMARVVPDVSASPYPPHGPKLIMLTEQGKKAAATR